MKQGLFEQEKKRSAALANTTRDLVQAVRQRNEKEVIRLRKAIRESAGDFENKVRDALDFELGFVE